MERVESQEFLIDLLEKQRQYRHLRDVMIAPVLNLHTALRRLSMTPEFTEIQEDVSKTEGPQITPRNRERLRSITIGSLYELTAIKAMIGMYMKSRCQAVIKGQGTLSFFEYLYRDQDPHVVNRGFGLSTLEVPKPSKSEEEETEQEETTVIPVPDALGIIFVDGHPLVKYFIECSMQNGLGYYYDKIRNLNKIKRDYPEELGLAQPFFVVPKTEERHGFQLAKVLRKTRRVDTVELPFTRPQFTREFERLFPPNCY